jgi:hypothetical protein
MPFGSSSSSGGGANAWRRGSAAVSERPDCIREILTIMILFQLSDYRTVKGYYTRHV